MGIRFDEKKNEGPILCRSAKLLACLIMLERDETAVSYFPPEMSLNVPCGTMKYSIPVHLWVRRVSGGPSFIGLLDTETETLFERYPEVLSKVREHARSINATYLPVRPGDLPGCDTVRAYISDLRRRRVLALWP